MTSSVQTRVTSCSWCELGTTVWPPAQLFDDPANIILTLRVKPIRRLVQEERGPAEQRLGEEPDAGASLGTIAYILLRSAFQTNARQGFAHPLADLGARDIRQVGDHLQVWADAHPRREEKLLRLIAERGPHAILWCDLSPIRVEKAGNQPEERRLAGPVWTQNAQHLAPWNRKVDVVDGD